MIHPLPDLKEQAPSSSPSEFGPLLDNSASMVAFAEKTWGHNSTRFLNWRWQMSHQIRNAADAKRLFAISAGEEKGYLELDALFNSGTTPYYAAVMASLPAEKQNSIRLQSIPNIVERNDPFGLKDPLLEKEHSPVPEVVHVYPDRVAFCVAMLCPVYCRYCYRKRRDDESGLHYNRSIIDRGVRYIKGNPAIKDVLITGGDPFIASDNAITGLLEQISQIPHVEVIRFGTRTPVTLPYRVTKELCQKIAKFHPIWLNTHFNCVEELTPDAEIAIRNLVDAGIVVGNQSVLLKGVNDSYEKMEALCRKLIRNRVRPYYVFHPHLIEGTEHLRVDIKRGMDIMDKLRGNLSGFAIPTYILDTPSGKIPLTRNRVLGFEGDDMLLENLHGGIYREIGAARAESENFANEKEKE